MALHQPFNILWGIVIDNLHGVFLGVTLTLLHLWLNKCHRGKPFSIGNKVLVYGVLGVPRDIQFVLPTDSGL
jgi:hypothetical protein